MNYEIPFIVQLETQNINIIYKYQGKIHGSAVQINDRYLVFADIFLSTRHINTMELNLIDRLLRRSDTVYRQVFTLFLQ